MSKLNSKIMNQQTLSSHTSKLRNQSSLKVNQRLKWELKMKLKQRRLKRKRSLNRNLLNQVASKGDSKNARSTLSKRRSKQL